ncbi:hypothetical protein TWF281_000801 [Arthrobotrys megalospora]
MPSDEKNDSERPFGRFGRDEPVSASYGHGTPVASKIFGFAGMAASADLVVVKQGAGSSPFETAERNGHLSILKELEKLNAYIFFAGGNLRLGRSIVTSPTYWVLGAQADDPNALTKTAVVGGVSSKTLKIFFQTHPSVRFFAPATNIAVPDLWGADLALPSALRLASGTSFG